MRTLQVGLRVSDLERSLAFYTAVGYTVVGTVEETAFDSLTMLRLPGDGFVTIELVYDSARAQSTSAPASTTSSSKSSRWTRPWPILPRRGSWPSHPDCPPARPRCGPVGSPDLMELPGTKVRRCSRAALIARLTDQADHQ